MPWLRRRSHRLSGREVDCIWVIITMGKPIKRSLGQRVIQGCCSLLFVAGVLVFFQGVYGIVYGALLILLGVGVAIVGVKDPRTQDRS